MTQLEEELKSYEDMGWPYPQHVYPEIKKAAQAWQLMLYMFNTMAFDDKPPATFTHDCFMEALKKYNEA